MQTKDSILRLNDIWALETINGESPDWSIGQERPVLEINLRKMQIFGHDSCNQFTGGIKHLDTSEIIFGVIAATRKVCVNMHIPDKFHLNLNLVQAYSLNALKLHLFDSQGIELFIFRKVD